MKNQNKKDGKPTSIKKNVQTKGKIPTASKPTEPEVPNAQLPFTVPTIESGYMEVRDVKGNHVLASIDLYRATNLERRNRRPLWIISFSDSEIAPIILDATQDTQRDGFRLALRGLKYPENIMQAALLQIKANHTVRDGTKSKPKA